MHSFCLLLFSIIGSGYALKEDDYRMHPDLRTDGHEDGLTARINLLELQSDYWQHNADIHLQEKLIGKLVKQNVNKAKNVIMFLGDGLSFPTISAARMYMGGEEVELEFEKFPHFGLSKTFCIDRQVADSACSSTAYLGGVKGNYATMGLNGKGLRYNCTAQNDPTTHVQSIAEWAQRDCRSTGFVTTTRVTHASPGGLYAHIGNRDWENDQEVAKNNCDPNETVDIARQLIENVVGDKLKVVMGCGRSDFRDAQIVDEEGVRGNRGDGKDLIDDWLINHRDRGNASYIWNRQSLKAIDINRTDYLLGLFDADMCMYNLEVKERQAEDMEPTLSDMTDVAIKLLQKNRDDGYFLFVEGGLIDWAHHDNQARIALDETVEFNKAIQLALRLTNEEDTLIVVTADHSHVMTYNGYPNRGRDVLGLTGRTGDDGLPFPTLSYANGMGWYNSIDENGNRKNLTDTDFTDMYLAYMTTAPRDFDTHGGDDVGIYAIGPWSHLFNGNYEQYNIPMMMAYAAKMGPYAEEDKKCNSDKIRLSIVLSFTYLIIFSIIKLL